MAEPVPMPDPRPFATYVVDKAAAPVIATAVHAGHDVRDELAGLLALDAAARLREEDPYTGEWTACAPARVVVHRSRFEVDVNRPPEKAVYRTPADAWGLEVWREPLSEDMVAASLSEYDTFYAVMKGICDAFVEKRGGFVLLDLHSYNHRRGGETAPVDDPAVNPEVNIGTGTLARERFSPVVDQATAIFAEAGFDVRENVKFRGGNLSAWVHANYPTGCALAIEFKKTWMDEWSGARDDGAHARIGETLAAVAAAVPAALRGALA